MLRRGMSLPILDISYPQHSILDSHTSNEFELNDVVCTPRTNDGQERTASRRGPAVLLNQTDQIRKMSIAQNMTKGGTATAPHEQERRDEAHDIGSSGWEPNLFSPSSIVLHLITMRPTLHLLLRRHQRKPYSPS